MNKKMLNISNHQGNINQKHNEISPHTSQNDYKENTKIGKDVEEREPIIGGNINWYTNIKNIM